MRFRSVTALALVAVFAGCESSDPVTPQVDVDAALSQLDAGASTYGGFGLGATLPSPGTHASDCTFDAPSGFFKCAPVNSNGVAFNRQFQLLDATGAPLSSVNPLMVASIRSVTDVEGSFQPTASDPVTFDIKRHDDATLSGIQSTSRVLNGTATQDLVASVEGSSLTMNDTTVTTQLLLPSTPQQKYPLGGKVVSSGTMTEPGSAAEKYRIEVAFDGTSVVTVKYMFGSTTLTCKVNMASPSADPVCT